MFVVYLSCAIFFLAITSLLQSITAQNTLVAMNYLKQVCKKISTLHVFIHQDILQSHKKKTTLKKKTSRSGFFGMGRVRTAAIQLFVKLFVPLLLRARQTYFFLNRKRIKLRLTSFIVWACEAVYAWFLRSKRCATFACCCCSPRIQTFSHKNSTEEEQRCFVRFHSPSFH